MFIVKRLGLGLGMGNANRNREYPTLVLKHYQAKKNGPLMGQAFLDLSDPGDGGMGWQNLRKWEKL